MGIWVLVLNFLLTTQAQAGSCSSVPTTDAYADVRAFVESVKNQNPGCETVDFLKDRKTGEVINNDKGVSTSYASSSEGFLTQPVYKEGGDENYFWSLEQYKGVQNLDTYATVSEKPGEHGMSLQEKFYRAIYKIDPELAQDQNFWKYIRDDDGAFHQKFMPHPGADWANGSCLVWSAWNGNQDVVKTFQNIDDGILCDGIMFEREELGELMTALGADPLKNGTIFEYEPDRKHYLYQPLVDNPADPNEPIRNELVSARDVEDSNLALASLGRFANAYGFTPNQTKDALPQDPSKIIRTPITPDSIVAQAKLAYQGSGSVIFDLHLGTSNVWNQSIEHMVDVSYDEVDRSQLGQYIGSQDLVASPESAGMVEQIKEAEADLEYMSLHDRRRPIPYSQPDGRHPSEPQVSPYLLKLRALVQSSSSSAPANESMLEQVHELKAIEQKLLDAGKVSSDPNKKFIKHRIFVKYTNEAKAGVNGDVPSGVMSLEYLSVVNSADGSTRSSWLPPPTEKLSQICSDASKPGFDPNTVLGARVVENERSSAKLKKYSSYGLVEYIDPKLDSICAGNTSGNCAQSLHAQCAELQKGPSFDREVAIGVFPPKRVKVNYSSDRPCYTAGDPNRTKACEFLLNKLATCDSGRKFSKVSKFVKDARAAVSGNSIEQSLPLLEQDYIAAHEAGGLSLDDFKTNAYLLKDVRELGAANARAAGETDPARIAQASQAAVDTVLKPLYDWISHN